MKLLLTGLPEDATESAVRAGMEKLGTVSSVQLVAKDSGETWAIVEMPITPDQAFKITQQVTDIWHAGNFVNVRILNY